jgi:hypothetical protein
MLCGVPCTDGEMYVGGGGGIPYEEIIDWGISDSVGESSQWHTVFLDDVGEVSVELLPEDLGHHTQHQPVRIHPPYSNSRSSK